MVMPGRNDAGDYRYAFNGMEYDNEIQGGQNSYTTEFRQYDPRLGRWKSLDPLMSMFPSLSPYVGFDNNPIYYNDPYGLASEVVTDPPPIQMSGDRGFDDKNADQNEMLLLPDNPTQGQVVTFVYTNDDKTTTSTWTYAETKTSNGTFARWEKGVSKSTGGNWGKGKYAYMEEVNRVKYLAKVEPRDPDLDNDGLDVGSKDPKNEAGSTVDTDAKDPIKPKKPTIVPPRNSNPPIPPPPPVIPPCFQTNTRPVNIVAPFNPNSWNLTNSVNTRNWLSGLARTLINNPNSTLTIIYNINVPNLPVNQAWNANNTQAGVANRVMGLNRALVIQRMLINMGVPGNQLNTGRGTTNNAMSATGILNTRVRIPCN